MNIRSRQRADPKAAPWKTHPADPAEFPWKNCGRQMRGPCGILSAQREKNTRSCLLELQEGESIVLETEKRSQILREILEAGFARGDSLTGLREKLGIDGETWERWLRDGGMPEDIVGLSRAMAEMCAPWVWGALLEQTRDGSIPAMKLYFELCKGGDTSPAAAVIPDPAVAALRQSILYVPPTNGVDETQHD